MIDATHDPALRSWVRSAGQPGCDFPIQNLPHGVFRRRGSSEAWRGGVAIGDQVLDLAALLRSGVADAAAPTLREALQAAAAEHLNGLLALGQPAWQALRQALSAWLSEGAPQAGALDGCLVPQNAVEHRLPAQIGDFTDFFTSWHHMLQAGRVFHPDAPPLPNFRWLPIAYHGRASTVEVSGAAVYWPHGQVLPPGATVPVYPPTACLDHEFELGIWVGPGNRRGERIAAEAAEAHVFGLSLLNDWSARDVQAWESMPLGPFLAKNFLTSVSPWIVTMAALAPYRCALPRTDDDPAELPHLRLAAPARAGLDIVLQTLLATASSGGEAWEIARSNARHGYWSVAQMLAHHTEGGCALRPGDLLGTGTQSGPGEGEQGCLLELTRHARQPLQLPNGEQRGYLQDGDTLILRAWCERPGQARVGFGECRGTVMAAC